MPSRREKNYSSFFPVNAWLLWRHMCYYGNHQLTCLLPYCYPIQTTWWFITLMWLHASNPSCNLSNESSRDLNWVAPSQGTHYLNPSKWSIQICRPIFRWNGMVRSCSKGKKGCYKHEKLLNNFWKRKLLQNEEEISQVSVFAVSQSMQCNTEEHYFNNNWREIFNHPLLLKVHWNI